MLMLTKTILLGMAFFALSCAAGGSGPKGSASSDPSVAPTDSGPPQTIDISGIGGPGSSGTPGIAINPTCTSDCTDFPEAPVVDPASGPLPANVAALFGAPDATASGVICISEPQLSDGDRPGALVPVNWLRPRFRFEAPAALDVFEIRLTSPHQKFPLVVYTTNQQWTIPKELWENGAVNLAGAEVQVSVRGISKAAPSKPVGTLGSFGIAPVAAGGSLVYWATTSAEVSPTTSKLVGFRVGDEGVVDALTIPQVQKSGILNEGGNALRGKHDAPRGVPPGHVQCIGCHVSTPDGESVAFTDHWPWDNVLSSIKPETTGQEPAYLTPGASALLGQPWLGMMTFSAAHWKTGDRIALSVWSPRNGGVGFTGQGPYPSRSDGLAWFDLEAPAAIPWQENQVMSTNQAIQAQMGKGFGFLALTGETRSLAAPDFSNDGSRVVYTSAEVTQDGRIGAGQPNNETDIHWVPFNARQGGQVVALQGASEPGIAEYYPSFSSDDAFIAFNRAPNTAGLTYYRPDGEVWIIGKDGGVATRLLANDPPACTHEASPGIINSWAKWSPAVQQAGGKSYYFLIFSSARKYPGAFIVPKHPLGYSPPDTRASQLYMATVVRDDASGKLTTYPAVYLWNQAPDTSNLTPAWDEFQIPPVVVIR